MTVNLPTIHPSYNGNRDGWQDPPCEGECAICQAIAPRGGKKVTPAHPIQEFRYNPMRTGEMAEWLKAAVC
jgi:hypothetical protein